MGREGGGLGREDGCGGLLEERDGVGRECGHFADIGCGPKR